jgi:hypothetical protein
MDSIRRRLRACAWTALVDFGWMALAPVLAQATPAPAAGWAEVCTAQGLERLAIDDTTDDPGAPSRSTQPAHCPLCSSAAGLAPPPQPARLPAADRAAPARPPLLDRIGGPGRWWPATAARAPPARVRT